MLWKYCQVGTAYMLFNFSFAIFKSISFKRWIHNCWICCHNVFIPVCRSFFFFCPISTEGFCAPPPQSNTLDSAQCLITTAHMSWTKLYLSREKLCVVFQDYCESRIDGSNCYTSHILQKSNGIILSKVQIRLKSIKRMNRQSERQTLSDTKQTKKLDHNSKQSSM